MNDDYQLISQLLLLWLFINIHEVLWLCLTSSTRNIGKQTKKNIEDTLPHYSLVAPHPLLNTYGLVQFWNNDWIDHQSEHVPQVMVSTIPWLHSGIAFIIFVLAHFKTFIAAKPLFQPGDSVQDAFKTFRYLRWPKRLYDSGMPPMNVKMPMMENKCKKKCVWLMNLSCLPNLPFLTRIRFLL